MEQFLEKAAVMLDQKPPKPMKQLMDGLVDEIKTVQGISKMLITRASTMNNDIIRIDTSVSSALSLPPDLDRIARAENFVEDGKIDARRD